MNKASQQFIFVPFLQGFISFSVSSSEPNSCLLSKMCMAYAEVGLFRSLLFLGSLADGGNKLFRNVSKNYQSTQRYTPEDFNCYK